VFPHPCLGPGLTWVAAVRHPCRVVNRDFLVERAGSSAVIRLAGEIDAVAAPAVERAMRRATGMPVQTVVLDLSGVLFIDSGGLGAIVAAYREAAARRVGFRLGEPATPAVARVLRATGLDDGLTLEPPGQRADAAGGF
jgi:anti-sigma B factor antagonist